MSFYDGFQDLLCDEPSSLYWRGMAEKFEKEIDRELENSFNVGLCVCCNIALILLN